MRLKKLLCPHGLWNEAEVVDARKLENTLPAHTIHQYRKALESLKSRMATS